MPLSPSDLEVKLKSEQTKAIIEGKTSVPFKTFFALVLQRKVIPLFKDRGDEPVILSSKLLTEIASAPQDSQENRAQLVLVTLGVGVLSGVFVMAIIQAVLLTIGMSLGQKEYLILACSIAALALLSTVLSRVQRGNRAQKVADQMEKLSSLLSK